MLTCRRTVRQSFSRSIGTLTALAIAGLLPASAEAQNAAQPGKWTIELYGGGSSASESSRGTPIASFPAGTPFTLASGAPSRAVSSWFFGDGAVLLNQVLTQFAANTGATFPRIASLDDALKAGGARQPSGGLIGLRLGRALTPKLSLEFNVERSLAKAGFSNSMMDALQEAKDSFQEAFDALLSPTNAPVTNLSVTSSVTTRDDSTSQMRFAGALKWTVFSGSKLEGYLTGGGGVIMNSGDDPQAVLNGRYTFRLFGTFPMDEIDRAVVTVNRQKNSAMGLVGGGVTYALSSSTGLRGDVRLLLNSAKDVTTLTSAPAVTLSTVLPQVLSTATNVSPGLQFSSQSGVRSTLSGPNANLTVFNASGLSKQVTFSLGIFKRF